MSNTPPHHAAMPTQSDALAIDALVEAGWDLERVPPTLRERAARITRLMNAVGSVKVRPDRVLVDLAFVRAMRAAEQSSSDTASLHPADQEAIDAWMLSGFDASRVPSSLRARVRKHEALGSLIAGVVPPRTAPDALIDRTLRAVAEADSGRLSRLRIAPERARRFPRVRINDLVSVAAMLLIGAAVAIPVVSSTRAHVRQSLCQANLGSTALAMASYAADNRDVFPVANAGFQGGTWWNVGKDRNASNSANLFSLVAAGYAELKDLACPGNPQAATESDQTSGFDWRQIEQVSYSYRLVPAGAPPRAHDDPQGVILADRSPVVLMAIRGMPVDPESNSPNHTNRGQHLLKSDGSTHWTRSPVLEDNGDNIWLPRSIENKLRALQGRPRIEPIRGNELPSTPMDVFLGP